MFEILNMFRPIYELSFGRIESNGFLTDPVMRAKNQRSIFKNRQIMTKHFSSGTESKQVKWSPDYRCNLPRIWTPLSHFYL